MLHITFSYINQKGENDMAKYVYPAVFTKDGDGYSILFPDLDGCYTCGDDLANGMEMAEDALALFLYNFERESRPIPAATPLEKVSSADDSFVTYVYCDTLVYQKRNNNRAVKKTLSIPEWLNEAAASAGINFSQVLQDALKAQLQIV